MVILLSSSAAFGRWFFSLRPAEFEPDPEPVSSKRGSGLDPQGFVQLEKFVQCQQRWLSWHCTFLPQTISCKNIDPAYVSPYCTGGQHSSSRRARQRTEEGVR